MEICWMDLFDLLTSLWRVNVVFCPGRKVVVVVGCEVASSEERKNVSLRVF